MDDEQFAKHRWTDGSFNWWKLYEEQFGNLPSDKAATYAYDCDVIRTIKSRQVAAVVLMRMKELTDEQ